jgi:hypothetical protein
MLGGQKEH